MSVLSEFKAFLLRGNIVDLAVAVVIGVAFNNVIQALVKDLLTPLIAAIGAQPDFASLYVTLNNSRFKYGDFLDNLITFLLVATAVFFLVVLPMNHLIRFSQRFGRPVEPTKRNCTECLSEIPIEARRCAFCTSPQ